MQHQSVQKRGEIHTILFDMDGLLLDTEDVYTRITQEIVRCYGKNYDWETKSKIMGKTTLDAARTLVELLELPITPEEYIELTKPKQYELFPEAQPLPGVARLIRHLHHHNVKKAIATSSHSMAFDLKTQNHQELFGHFEIVVKGDDPAVKRGKPSPDIFIVAAKRLGIAEDEFHKVLVFEDAPNGVAAAKAAGMNVVAIPHPMNSTSLFEEADLILESMEHFKPEEWCLPALLD